ncbi:hypothetical protein ACGFMM_07595 [Streptomyces sp. NPDC048604]|uniref:hypothetical protein n=1 Tax=Streptomyces sp. NPDC048604 TaxID=3365578 RepID=UPI00371B1B48
MNPFMQQSRLLLVEASEEEGDDWLVVASIGVGRVSAGAECWVVVGAICKPAVLAADQNADAGGT